MNTVQELHIALDQQMQANNTNSGRGLHPEERDLLLNNAVEIFLNNRIKDNENSIKRIRDLQYLKSPNPVILPVYVNSYDSVYSELPVDYLSYINSASIVEPSCKPTTLTKVSSNLPMWYFVLANDVGTAPLYKTFSITLDNSTIVYSKSNNITINSNSSKFMLINDMLETINNTKIYSYGGNSYSLSCYYEYYGDIYIPNGVIITLNSSTTSIIPTISASYTGVVLTVNPNSYSRNVYNHIFSNTIKSYNELDSSFSTDDQLGTIYGSKNRHRKPLCSISTNRLIVYHSNLFVIKEVEIEYYRKPIRIDLAKGQMPKLPFIEIVPLAVQLAKSYVADPSYELTKDANQIIE